MVALLLPLALAHAGGPTHAEAPSKSQRAEVPSEPHRAVLDTALAASRRPANKLHAPLPHCSDHDQFGCIRVPIKAKRNRSVENDQSSFIAKVFYLNLDSSVQKRVAMEQQLTNVSHARVPTVRLSVNSSYNSHFPNGACWPHNAWKHHNGAVSIFWSYHNFLDDVCNGRLEGLREGDLILLLQDDVTLVPYWEHRADAMVRQLPADWNTARLSLWGKMRETDRINDHWFRAVDAEFAQYTKYDAQPRAGLYAGAQAILFEVGARSRPVCALFRRSPVCHVDYAIFSSPEIHNYAAAKKRRITLPHGKAALNMSDRVAVGDAYAHGTRYVKSKRTKDKLKEAKKPPADSYTIAV